ncbi:hypothetical protein [Salininema proteolyticum]|uniref:Uncharacterized protein n=1 Tax=Salininema proteolyticum TaxID=1607685 RepID=A0ABV8TXF6_9ACTN
MNQQREWWIQVTYPGLTGHIDDETADEAMSTLPGLAQVRTGPAESVMQCSITAAALAEAIAEALKATERVWRDQLDGEGTATAVRALDRAEHDGELVEFGPINLVGLAGIARLLDVSRPRASEIVNLFGFPDPVGVSDNGRYWALNEVIRWKPTWERKPGRPGAKRPKATTGKTGRRLPLPTGEDLEKMAAAMGFNDAFAKLAEEGKLSTKEVGVLSMFLPGIRTMTVGQYPLIIHAVQYAEDALAGGDTAGAESWADDIAAHLKAPQAAHLIMAYLRYATDQKSA